MENNENPVVREGRTPEPQVQPDERRRRSRSRGSNASEVRSRSASRPRSRSGSQVVRRFTVSENNVPRPATLVIDPPAQGEEAPEAGDNEADLEVQDILERSAAPNAEAGSTHHNPQDENRQAQRQAQSLAGRVPDLGNVPARAQPDPQGELHAKLVELLQRQSDQQSDARAEAQQLLQDQQYRFERTIQAERERAERTQSHFLDALADLRLSRRNSISSEAGRRRPLVAEPVEPPIPRHLYDEALDPGSLTEDQREKAGLLPVLKSVAAAQRVEFDPEQQHLRPHALADLNLNAGGSQIERALNYERSFVQKSAREPFLEELSRYELFNEAGLPATLGPITFDAVPEGSRKIMSQRDFTELLKRMRPRTLPTSPDTSFGIKVREICRTGDGLLTRRQLTELILGCCAGQLSVDVRYALMANNLNEALNEICRSFGKIPHRSDMEVNTLTRRITAKNFIADMQRFHTNQLQLREADGRDLGNADSEIIELSKGQLPAPLVRFAVDLVGRYRERKQGPPLTWYHYRDALVKHAREKQLFPGSSDIYAVEAEANKPNMDFRAPRNVGNIKAVSSEEVHNESGEPNEIVQAIKRITDQTRRSMERVATEMKSANRTNTNLIKNIQDMNKVGPRQIFQPQGFGYPQNYQPQHNHDQYPPSGRNDYSRGHPGGMNGNRNHNNNRGHNNANNEAFLQPLDVGSEEHKKVARSWDNLVKVPNQLSLAFREANGGKGRNLGRGRLREAHPNKASAHRWHPSYPGYYYLDGVRYTGPVFMTNKAGREVIAYNCLSWASEHCFRCGNTHCGHGAQSCPYINKTQSFLFCERCRAGFHLLRDCKCFVEPDNKGLHQGN